MKDLFHSSHQKVCHKVVQSVRQTEGEQVTPGTPLPQTERQKKKQAKQRIKEMKQNQPHVPPTPEEQNKKMQNRVPVFDRINNAKPKAMKPTRKKTPRI